MVKNTARALKDPFKKLTKWARRHPKMAGLYALAGILTLIPIVHLGWLLITRSVNVPFWDQWIYVDLLEKWHNGSLTVYDLWKQHNEHRIMIPKFVQLLMASVTGWNIRFEIVANFAIGVASFSFMLMLLKQTFKDKWTAFCIASPLIAWLFFSPVQYINWIWGFQLAWFLSVLAVILTVWALVKHDFKTMDRFFIIALVGGVVATYSMGNGMLVWFVGLGVMALRRATKAHYLVWAATAVPVILSYFYKFRRPSSASPLYLLMHRFGDLTNYFFTYLGRNLAITQSSAKNTGIALCIVLLVSVFLLWRKKRLEPSVPWLAIAAYGLLTAVLAAFSRMNDYGVGHAMVQSYTTISVLCVIGTLVTLIYTTSTYLESASVKVLKRYLVAGFALGVLAFPLANGFWANYTKGVGQLKELSAHFMRVRHCVFTAQSPQDACLSIVYPDNKLAWEKIETLKRLHWSDF